MLTRTDNRTTVQQIMAAYTQRHGDTAAIDRAATKEHIAWLQGRLDAEQAHPMYGAEAALHKRHRSILTHLKRADRLYELLAAEGVL